MSMALALDFGAQWLRGQYGWKPSECGVQLGALPPADAGVFYVALEDAGVTAGSDLTPSLKEVLDLEIGIWRRPEHLTGRDKRGHLKLPIDKYLLGAWTLHDLERAVILPESGGLHFNFLFMKKLNEHWKLPNNDYGGAFHRPLFYRGRTRMETVGVDDQNTVQAWYGYRLRFRGLDREQRLANTSYAQG